MFDSFFYFFHALIVFAVPVLFGWCLLRRIVRESDLLVLIPGSFVAGNAALMGLVNELRQFAEMSTALAASYKLLLGGAAIAVLAERRPPALELAAGFRPRRRLALVSLGAVLAAFYFGIPAFDGILNDAWWGHYPIAVEIQDAARFPLHHVMAVDDPLFYHYGPDILAATWSSLLNLPVQTAFALLITIQVPAVLLLSTALVARFSGRFWSAILGGALALVGGNLRFMALAGAEWHNPASILASLNSQVIQGLIQMVFTPSHAVGIPLLLLALAVFDRYRRTFSLRDGLVLGLITGALTLVAEWYFLPLLAAYCIWSLIRSGRHGKDCGGRLRAAMRHALPAVVAILCGVFDNTYLSGTMGGYWGSHDSFALEIRARDISRIVASPPSGSPALAPGSEWGADGENVGFAPVQPRAASSLVPVHFGFQHWGQVPTWDQAGSNQNPYISVLNPKVLSEAFPVVLLGLPLGLWLALRKREPVPAMLASIAIISLIPPLFLNWDFRSVDFLRFLTGTFTCSALLLGWILGTWVESSRRAVRTAGWAIAGLALANSAALGVVGLMPTTVATVKAVSFQAASLSSYVNRVQTEGAEALDVPQSAAAFESLSSEAGDFLYPLAKGRERALVLVAPDELPPLKTFPEWLKFPTLARAPVPVGWYWEISTYSLLYREAATTLSDSALERLNVHWIVVTNTLGYQLPAQTLGRLGDGRRFVRVRTFRSGRYFLAIYRVRP